MTSQSGHTRDDIVEAARTLFYQRGYARTSFSDIVSHTGIQRGNIYHYFKTKNDILDAVINHLASEYREALSAWDAELSDPKDRLRRFVQMVLSNRDKLSRYGCPVGSLNTELGKEAACGQQESARQLFDLFLDWLAEQFCALTESRQARSLALHLLGRTEGISLMGHVYQDPDYIRKEIEMLEEWIDAL